MGLGGRRAFLSAMKPKRELLGGASGSENVGTSNRKEGEIPSRRNTEVSFAMLINEGLVGPKEMVKTVSDGHMVNIP